MLTLKKLKKVKIIGDIDFNFMEKNGKWKCLMCEYETGEKILLRDHFRIHTGEKPSKK